MEFEWDENKNISNLKKHKISFELITLIFDENLITIIDDRKNYNEVRYIGFGLIQKRCINVVYTKRKNNIRIISGRKANAKETKKYFETVARIRQNSK